MDTKILAILIQEGSRLATEYLKGRSTPRPQVTVESLEKFVQDTDTRFSPFVVQEGVEVPEKPSEITIEKPSQTVNINIEQPVTKATEIATGCVPCAMGHFGTCSGILNESIRFAHSDEGLASPEVIDRINMCMDELNAMERVDLRPEMTVQLKGWEKELAEKALTESRSIRHMLEGISSIDELEKAAAVTQTSRKAIGQQWFQNKLSNMTPEDKEEIHRRVMAKIEEMATMEAE